MIMAWGFRALGFRVLGLSGHCMGMYISIGIRACAFGFRIGGGSKGRPSTRLITKNGNSHKCNATMQRQAGGPIFF